ncbi:hypothetical protein PAHAL_4G141700 [Panicum hallii]|uniref:Uncharacterized protein n=1 Tax=Panicum hallii TaxID=206008 RepID=A0A2T8JCV0_9POAL|nr:hypothetical protein PAHAL_4G141700 [Panicum hallii]
MDLRPLSAPGRSPNDATTRTGTADLQSCGLTGLRAAAGRGSPPTDVTVPRLGDLVFNFPSSRRATLSSSVHV